MTRTTPGVERTAFVRAAIALGALFMVAASAMTTACDYGTPTRPLTTTITPITPTTPTPTTPTTPATPVPDPPVVTPVSLRIPAGPVNFRLGASAPVFAATLVNSDGSTRDVTTTVVWRSSDPSVVSIDGAGLVHGLAVGVATVWATLGTLTSNTATIDVVEEFPGAPAANWSLTTVLVSIDGPNACFNQFLGPVGTSTSWLMNVTRSGSSVSFDYDVRNYPTDDYVETGAVTGTTFSARGSVQASMFPPCDGTPMTGGSFVGTVTGAFSADGQHLTATEVWDYQFPWGETKFTLAWTGDARNQPSSSAMPARVRR